MNKTRKSPSTSRGRGPYNRACQVCARKKVKCDGGKPVCQQCHSQQRECTWAKSPVRKPHSEAYVEALHKQVENLRKSTAKMREYGDYLESLLKDQSTIDFRASRPPDLDVLMGQPEDEADRITEAEDEGSDDENHPNIMAICIPPQSLQVAPFTRFPLEKNPDHTYVLVVEGVPPSQCNPALEWSRHLAPHVALDRRSHDKALDLLFKFHASWCLRIIPDLFLRDMYRALKVPPTQTPPKTPHYSPMLHNALVALALAFMDEPLKDLKTRQCYAIHAKSYIEAECRKPDLSGVHALALLGSFHSSQGDQTLGYMYFGMSARMSQTLGLNNDCSEWVKLGMMDETERLDRHWASWTNFAQDVCWSLYVGRDFSVPEPVGAKATPMPHIDSEFDSMDWFYPPAKIAPQPNNLTKIFEATCRLLMIARHIMNLINGSVNKARSRPLLLGTLIGNIDVELNKWKGSLTEDLDITPRSLLRATPHKLMLHLAYWWLFILLHRPFFQRKKPIRSTDREIDHVKLCRSAAEHIMELLSTWRTLYTLRYCPVTLIQTAFSAGTVYLLIAMQASSGARTADKELRHSLDQEILLHQYLQEVGLSWNCATHVSHTLRNLRKEHVRPLLDDLDRKNTLNAGLHIPDIRDDEEEDNSGVSRSSSRRRSPTARRKSRQFSKPRSGSDLLALPNHILTASTTTITSTSSTHGVPISIRSERSIPSNSSSIPDPWGPQPSSGSIPNSNYLPIAHRGLEGASQPFSDDMDNPFSGNGGCEDVGGQAFRGQGSTHHIQPSPSSSSRNYRVRGPLGMLGGQTLPEEPASVGLFIEADTPNCPFGPAFLNQGSASFGPDHLPSSASSSHGDNDNMELDSATWTQSFS